MSAQAATAVKTGTFSTGLMDIQSMDSGGFTAIMDDADPSQTFVFYFAIGDAAVGNPWHYYQMMRQQ